MKGPVCMCGAPLRRLIADAEYEYSRPYLIYRCETCDLLSPDPLPTPESVRESYRAYGHYAEPDYLAKDLAAKRSQAVRLGRKIRAAIGPKEAQVRLLEVGCAAGALLENLKSEPWLDLTGVEVDPENARVAQDRMGGRVRVGTLVEAGFADDSFDVVYSDQVLEHVLDADALLAECRRVLRPGGALFVSTPNFDGFAARLLKLSWKEFVPDEHVRMFTPRALRFHLDRAGFERVRIVTQGLWLRRRRDGRDLLPVRSNGLVGRVLARGAMAVGVGDNLSALAFKRASA